ncbi:multidrug resistance protein [Saccharata proteae CBS 121410]|uniref:Multidrug resistance protein n=1 Tax=Saccharata proteae CBS 121410 TaxID=1314787 RepID=A0A6A5YFS0_9PEZI|nr:multidrug resistance protein [Saccharata proteae CBS 121410]
MADGGHKSEAEPANGTVLAVQGTAEDSGAATPEQEAINEDDSGASRLIWNASDNTDRLVVLISLVSAVVGGALMPLMTIVFGKMTGEFEKVETSSNAGSFSGELDHYTLYFVYLAIAEFVTVYVTTVGLTIAGERITCRVRERYLAALLNKGVAGLSDKQNASGEVATRISTDAELLKTALSEKLGRAIGAVSTVVTAFAVGFAFSWKLTLVLSSTLVAFVLVVGAFAQSMVKYTNRSTEAEAMAATVATETLSDMRGTAANCAQEERGSQYKAQLLEARRPRVLEKGYAAVMMAVVTGVMLLAYALAFWQGSRFLVAGDLSLADVMIVLLAVLLGTVSLGFAGPTVRAVADGLAATGRICRAIDADPPAGQDRLDQLKPTHLQGHVRFQAVDFRYPSRPDILVLDRFDLDVAPGQTTAVVGPSGSGKSTLVSLIERFYEPTNGIVSLDGQALDKFDLRWLRQHISVVGQDALLFDDTISENIGHGLVGSRFEHEPDDSIRERVRRAAELAHADAFIARLPRQYETRVGERGSMLSGGQRQRIAIARAIVSDPAILLLDEATSALDPVSERTVQAALRTAMQGRTNLIIAHRLATVKDADSIAVMGRGRVVEQGSYGELVENRGEFFRLLEAQSLAVDEGESDEDDLKSHDDEVQLEGSRPGSIMDEKMDGDVDKDAVGGGGEDGSGSTSIRFVSDLRAKDRTLLLAGFILSILLGCTGTTQSFILSACIAAFSKNAFDYPRLRHDVNFWAGMMLMLAFIGIIIQSGQGIILSLCSERLVRRARIALFQHLLRQDMSFFDAPEHSAGALSVLLSARAADLEGLGGLVLGMLLVGASTILSGFIVACALGWKLGLVCSATIPVLLAAGHLRTSFLNANEKRSAASYSSATSYAVEAASCIRVVASFTLEQTVLDKFRHTLISQSRTNAISTARSSVLFAASQALVYCSFALCFWYGGRLMVSGEYSMLQFFVCYSTVIFGAQSAGSTLAVAADRAKAIGAAHTIEKIMMTKPLIDAGNGSQLGFVQGSIELRNVSFTYSTRTERPALIDVSLTVQPGQFVALVGPSGSGKSTVLALLERFYDPARGTVSIDGKDIKDVDVSSIRSHVALVSQETMLCSGSLRENMLLGAPGSARNDENALQQACKDAALDELVASLPAGLETRVGNKGAALSGGQCQRIAIARALLRNPRILLLDEATSALDTASERVVQDALSKASKGRTTVAVAHRLSTIRHADVIYVLDRGHIVETGKHQELLSRQGLYASMVRAQSVET